MEVSTTSLSSSPPAGGDHNGAPDYKQLFRSVYALVKQLDDQKQGITTVEQLFDVDIMSIRSQLVEQSEALIFQPNITIGKKSREVLWRRGYYDFISITKRIRAAEAKQKPTSTDADLQLVQLMKLINEGISKYKAIIVRLERSYQLDLRNIVDFTLLDQSSSSSSVTPKDPEETTFTLEMINFTLETVHASLLSLGDLHRYFIDFNFEQPRSMHRDDAARFYFEAFKLNPKIGMAQNQLGTLYSGQNYNLDSTYHYLYSLVCRVPFELSENNVAKIFTVNSEHLELVDMDKMGVSVCDFLARFKLIADIFFYDKDVTDFNALCHRILIDLRTLLSTKRSQLNAELLFKVVAILFFCMTKLKARESTKLYSLNAFLVAICSELIDACIVHLEKFIGARVKQNEAFQESYGVYFELFDRDVRRSRETQRTLNGRAGGASTDDAALQNGKRLMNMGTNKSSQASVESSGTDLPGKSVVPHSSVNNNDTSSKRNSFDNGAGASGSSASGGTKDKDYSSDTKTPSSLPQPDKKAIKKKPVKLRRRRKKLNSCDTDYESDEVSESDYDMDSDFSSDESSLVDTDSSSSDDEDLEKSDKETTIKNDVATAEGDMTLTDQTFGYSDSDDIIVEEEKLVYMKDMLADTYNSLVSKMWPSANADEDDIVIEEESITFNLSGRSNSPTKAMENGNADVLKEISNLIITPLSNDTKDEPSRSQSAEKLRYKRKYAKIDPNILIDFAHQECTLQALKILFDWLKVNQDILQNCYSSNPEFVHKIMKLMNHFNIDIFTRKVCFDRGLIKSADVRPGLRGLFDIRISIPLREDILLKDFPILEAVQQPIDFELPLQMAITDSEENILRILKLVDFGFFVCKSKKFRYNFCARSRMFIEAGVNGGGQERHEGVRVREKRQRRNDRRRGFVQRKSENGRRGKRQRQRNSYTSNDDIELAVDGGLPDAEDGMPKLASLPKKSYLKNRTLQHTLEKENLKLDNADVAILNGTNGSAKIENKYEIMGKLWLRNEVKTLESKISKKPEQNLTPYLVMDTMALTDFANIVKSLIKTKKFVVLVPSAVLSELDDLKKSSEGARNAIRWLESEFSKGSRFLRLQRSDETLAIPLLKVPRKLPREATVFLQMAQFCNYMQTHHSDGSEHRVLTLLTGTHLNDRKLSNFSFTGVMTAVSVHFEQVAAFYGKYKKK